MQVIANEDLLQRCCIAEVVPAVVGRDSLARQDGAEEVTRGHDQVLSLGGSGRRTGCIFVGVAVGLFVRRVADQGEEQQVLQAVRIPGIEQKAAERVGVFLERRRCALLATGAAP